MFLRNECCSDPIVVLRVILDVSLDAAAHKGTVVVAVVMRMPVESRMTDHDIYADPSNGIDLVLKHHLVIAVV